MPYFVSSPAAPSGQGAALPGPQTAAAPTMPARAPARPANGPAPLRVPTGDRPSLVQVSRAPAGSLAAAISRPRNEVLLPKLIRDNQADTTLHVGPASLHEPSVRESSHVAANVLELIFDGTLQRGELLAFGLVHVTPIANEVDAFDVELPGGVHATRSEEELRLHFFLEHQWQTHAGNPDSAAPANFSLAGPETLPPVEAGTPSAASSMSWLDEDGMDSEDWHSAVDHLEPVPADASLDAPEIGLEEFDNVISDDEWEHVPSNASNETPFPCSTRSDTDMLGPRAEAEPTIGPLRVTAAIETPLEDDWEYVTAFDKSDSDPHGIPEQPVAGRVSGTGFSSAVAHVEEQAAATYESDAFASCSNQAVQGLASNSMPGDLRVSAPQSGRSHPLGNFFFNAPADRSAAPQEARRMVQTTPYVSRAARPYGTVITTYFSHNLDMHALQKRLGKTHLLVEVSGANCDCWMRSFWLCALRDAAPGQVGIELTRKLGPAYQSQIAVVEALSRTLRSRAGTSKSKRDYQQDFESEQAIKQLSEALLHIEIESRVVGAGNMDPVPEYGELGPFPIESQAQLAAQRRVATQSAIGSDMGEFDQIAVLAGALNVATIVISTNPIPLIKTIAPCGHSLNDLPILQTSVLQTIEDAQGRRADWQPTGNHVAAWAQNTNAMTKVLQGFCLLRHKGNHYNAFVRRA